MWGPQAGAATPPAAYRVLDGFTGMLDFSSPLHRAAEAAKLDFGSPYGAQAAANLDYGSPQHRQREAATLDYANPQHRAPEAAKLEFGSPKHSVHQDTGDFFEMHLRKMMDAPSFVAGPGRSGLNNASKPFGPPIGVTASEASTHTPSGSERPCAPEATYSNSTSSGTFASGRGGAFGQGSDGDPASPEREPTQRWFPDKEQTQRWLGADQGAYMWAGVQAWSPPPPLPRQIVEPAAAEPLRHATPLRSQAPQHADPGQLHQNADSPQREPSSSSRSRPAHPVSSQAWAESRPWVLQPPQNEPYFAAAPNSHTAPHSQVPALSSYPPPAPPLWEMGQQRHGPADDAGYPHASAAPPLARPARHRHEMHRSASPSREMPAINAEQYDREAIALCGMGALLQAPEADSKLLPRPAAAARARTPSAPQQARSTTPTAAVPRKTAGTVQVPAGQPRRPNQQQLEGSPPPQRRAPQHRPEKKKQPERCLQCRQEPSSYLDHTCPKCGAMVCAVCLDDFRMIAKSYRCPRCGDEQSNQERLQRNLWMMGAMRSTKLAFGALGQSIQDGFADLFATDAGQVDEPSTTWQYSQAPAAQNGGFHQSGASKATRQSVQDAYANPAHAGDGVCSGPTYTSRYAARSGEAEVVSRPEHRTRPPPDWFQGAGAGISSLFGIGGDEQVVAGGASGGARPAAQQEVFHTRLLNE